VNCGCSSGAKQLDKLGGGGACAIQAVGSIVRGGVGAMDDGPRGVRVEGVVQGQVLGGHDGGHWVGVSVGSGLPGGGGYQAARCCFGSPSRW
jgi:hypothetical protein